MKRAAEKIGLDGYVCNDKNGSVKAVVVCKKDDLDRLIISCYEGSDLSRVENVDYFILNNIDFSEIPNGFFIKY